LVRKKLVACRIVTNATRIRPSDPPDAASKRAAPPGAIAGEHIERKEE
jgi:hypothetical protein